MSKTLGWQLGLIALVMVTSTSDRADAAKARVVRVRLGSAADATPALLGPSFL